VESFFKPEFQETTLSPEHDAADLGGVVFQREVKVAGWRGPEVRDLTLNPNGRKFVLQEFPDLLSEFGNRKDLSLR
jgi:hypothetical protein